MKNDAARWASDYHLKDVALEFWREFSISWTVLKTEPWTELASTDKVDEDFFRVAERLHQTVLGLNSLIRSLSDYLSNQTSAAKDSDFTSLVAFIHDLRAPLAMTCGFSEIEVIRGFKGEAPFLQWRSLMMESLTRIDRVVEVNTTFFTDQQSTS